MSGVPKLQKGGHDPFSAVWTTISVDKGSLLDLFSKINKFDCRAADLRIQKSGERYQKKYQAVDRHVQMYSKFDCDLSRCVFMIWKP